MTIVSNPGPDRTVALQVFNNLGSDAGTTIGTTSSGDPDIAEVGDDWITSYKEFAGGSSPTPRLAHVLQSPGATVQVSALSFANGDDTPTWTYSFPVAAGQTVIVLNFAAGLGSKEDAALKAAQLAALPTTATACMTATEQMQVANMVAGALPTGPSATGPASITITSPTTEDTYTGTAPFLALGGLAGAAGLEEVRWSTDRGFEGTAQGTTDWTIPAAQLLPGDNVITVTADYGDAELTDVLTVTLAGLSYQLAEGATGSFFSTDILVANPNADEVDAEVEFQKADGTVIALPVQELPAKSRTTIPVGEQPGLENASMSTVVRSPDGAPLVVERAMFWDSTSYGSHGAAATESPGTRFAFAEGAQGFFDTYLLLSNSNTTMSANVTVRAFIAGQPVVTREFEVGSSSRLTVFLGDIPELVGQAFGLAVNADVPIMVERAMYFGTPLFNGGSVSPGASLPALNWHFAEGASGAFFDTYFLLSNGTLRAANVTMTYQLTTGATVEIAKVVPANGRLTVFAEEEHASLADAGFSLVVTSSEPITVERSIYWPGSPATWAESHNSFGVNEPGMKWGLADGRVGMSRGFETYILIGNSNDEACLVRATYLRVEGGSVTKDVMVPANSRFNIAVQTDVPELSNEEFSVVLEVLDGGPIVVERSMYSTSSGVPFAAGTNTQAVRLP
jgi:hypothetical protein